MVTMMGVIKHIERGPRDGQGKRACEREAANLDKGEELKKPSAFEKKSISKKSGNPFRQLTHSRNWEGEKRAFVGRACPQGREERKPSPLCDSGKDRPKKKFKKEEKEKRKQKKEKKKTKK